MEGGFCRDGMVLETGASDSYGRRNRIFYTYIGLLI